MRKSTRILKRLMALFLVVLISIESFAAVVSDNDGSAFITKAEFDSLKNDFQSQIDSYNSNIDSKIDNAIASYLAGVKVEVKSTKNLFINNWKYVVSMNGALKNQYDYPDVSGMQVVGERIIEYGETPQQLMSPDTMTVNNDWWKQIWSTGTFSYADASTRNTRNLVKNVVIGTTLDTSKMVWSGRGNNVRESWTLSCNKIYGNNPSGMVSNNTNNKIEYCEYLNLIRSGYIENYYDVTNPVWKTSVRWYNSGGSSWNWGYGSVRAISVVPTVNYEKDSNGDAKSYEHILSYKNDTSWTLCAEKVANYLGFASTSDDTRKTDVWAAKTTTSGTWNGCEFGFVKNYDATVYRRGIVLNAIQLDRPIAWTDNTYTGASNKKQIPVIGLIGNYAANRIHQFDDGDLKDDRGQKLTQRKLHEGVPLMKVSEKEKIEWEPSFKDIKVDGVSNVDECEIILAYEPFTNMINISNANNYVKMDGIDKGRTAVTTDKKVKIKFEADRDGYVYAKWIPNYDETIVDGNTFWEVTLDVANCGTYISTKE